MTRLLACTLAVVAVLAAGGCEWRTDDEVERPRVTEAAPPEVPRDLPPLPVGRPDARPSGPVTVEGTKIKAGARSVDVAPMRIDAHVAGAGGVYFVSAGELWFSDLDRLLPTPYHLVGELALTEDRTEITFLDLEHGAPGPLGGPMPLRVRYRLDTGKPLGAEYDDPAPDPVS